MKLPRPWRTRTQVRLARVLVLALLVTVPGLYGWTEFVPARSSPDSPEARARRPGTRLNLTPLSPHQRNQMRRHLKINLNRADTRQLRRLPGLGPVLARRVVRTRRRRGPFPALKALERVPGIGSATVERLRPRARVMGTDTSATFARRSDVPAPVPLNTADSAELQKLPGIGPVLAGRILRQRERRGSYERVKDLTAVRGIGPVTVRRLESRVRLEP